MRAAAECDAAVLHAGQGATAAVLLAGKPILQIPLVLEQRLTADATARLGAAEVVTDRAKDPAAAVQKLDLLLTDPRYATAARGFARKYSNFDPAEQVQRMVARVEELMQKGQTVRQAHGRQGEGETRGQGDTGTRGAGESVCGVAAAGRGRAEFLTPSDEFAPCKRVSCTTQCNGSADVQPGWCADGPAQPGR